MAPAPDAGTASADAGIALDECGLKTGWAGDEYCIRSLAGWSGVLDLMPGDKIDFECEIINKTNKNFTGANEAQDDEMCILVGDSAGTKVPLGCTAMAARRL